MQGGAPGVAGDLSCDVQDAVAQPLRFVDGMLAGEGQLLCPDMDVVSQQGELQPCGVCLKGLEREMPGTGGLERLDAILDFGVLRVQGLKCDDVLVGLVGDEALEAPVHVGEGELRAGVWVLALADQPGAVQPRGKVDLVSELG